MNKNENEFPSFPKIPRLAKQITVTEKIDGTNGLIEISVNEFGTWIRAGSRNRWLTQGEGGDTHFQVGGGQLISSDNYGFGRFVIDHAEELARLGPGRHYGEWFGSGIQRGYGMKNGQKRFALFNHSTDCACVPCVDYVPIMYCGDFSGQAIEEALHDLRRDGSKAAPGFMNPEGIVLRFHVNGVVYKAFCEDDGLPKGLATMANDPY